MKHATPIAASTILILAISMILVIPVVCAETDSSDRLQTVSGQVVEVDPAGSKLTINYRDSGSSSLAYMTLYVPSDAVLIGGIEDIVGLDDINVGDRLQIEFTGDPMDNPTAKRIKDLDRTNW
jgi:hypothetical protein